ncbi:LuxR C-terminal-related transcriptional regulator [Paenibacillus sp. NPDC056933]|uniref:LuxR C-terminal-related transcriptional regulator n=1 Tax=Paenibacillus sp. NPDC056933 TaxID=3345968 RepID=UPI003632784E
MPVPILFTKLHSPVLRSKLVDRPRLTELLDEGVQRKLTLVSAAAGSGKTTLVSQWLETSPHSIVWISLEEADNDPARFLMYLFAAMNHIVPSLDEGITMSIQSQQLLPTDTMITYLLNEVSVISNSIVLVLDDYHFIQSEQINDILGYMLDHMPSHMHLIITTRQQPRMSLPRLRARNQVIEIGDSDLRFTSTEANMFLNQVMGVILSQEDSMLLEARTEGWIAGLQLAALSIQRSSDPKAFMDSFNGNHPFILDYLVEEVLELQTERIQTFLLRTSILDRLCGPLCDAVFQAGNNKESLPVDSSGQHMLEWLEQSNLFVVPLDNERRWYRYHHLFADLLRKRLHQSLVNGTVDPENSIAEIHKLASIWYEDNNFELESFHHAAASGDIDRTARLLDGKGMPLLFRGAIAPALHWLRSLSATEMNAMPSLWVMYASALLMAGHLAEVEPKLKAAEQAIQLRGNAGVDPDIIGHMASIRATLAVSRHETDIIIAESQLALKSLHPDNLPVRAATAWTLGYAYQLQGKRDEAGLSYMEALLNSENIGHHIITIMATLGLGNIQEADNQLHLAAEHYRRVLNLAGNPPLPIACEAHLGLARVNYEWNELNAATHHAQQSVQLAHQFGQTDRVVASEVILAKVMVAASDICRAAAILKKNDVIARQQKYVKQIPGITAEYVLVLIHQNNLQEAERLSQESELPCSQARVLLAQGKISDALSIMESLLADTEASNSKDDQLKAKIFLAVIFHEHGMIERAKSLLEESLVIAEPAGMIRMFIDEGVPMYNLLKKMMPHGNVQSYWHQLWMAFEAERLRKGLTSDENRNMKQLQLNVSELKNDPLSERELEVLRLIDQGRSNREISEKLHIALPTVKGHNRAIFDKLQVKRRTEAVARAREWDLL